MVDSDDALNVRCPRCAGLHRARPVDRGHRVDWWVTCGEARVCAVSPPMRGEALADDVAANVRHELWRRLLVWPAELDECS